ncbi:MAG: ribosome biogenesis GTP-binding protein YihA/YsxC, partial [Syntrophales bacterium LBB04]|nr:ribosome biogenesis GTP-binding protein YihA/YsxC [Syntrophales bacterium LBB04]
MSITIKNPRFMLSAVKPAHYPPPGPPELALAGRSNVGKSSLLATLLGSRKLVRISGRPGCTQQINFFSLNDDLLRLVDLPGYGFAQVPLKVKAQWGPMIESYLAGRPTLKGVVVILDLRRDPSPDDLSLLGWLQVIGAPILLAVTKADKLSRNQAAGRQAQLRP